MDKLSYDGPIVLAVLDGVGLAPDSDGNAVVGANVHLNDCQGCIVHAPGASSVVLQGLEDCIVVERDGRLLICKLSEEQRIKDFIK